MMQWQRLRHAGKSWQVGMVGWELLLLPHVHVHRRDFPVAIGCVDRPVSMLLHHLIAFTAAVGSVSALDPLKDFCRLHSHRTAVFDRKLYIDGGFVNWAPLTASSVNETGDYLLDSSLSWINSL